MLRIWRGVAAQRARTRGVLRSIMRGKTERTARRCLQVGLHQH